MDCDSKMNIFLT